MNSEPLRPDEYSLAREARLLRRLIEESDNAGLKQKLVDSLRGVLSQDEARAIRENELLSRDALIMYAEACAHLISQILLEEIPDDENTRWRIVDRLAAELAGVPLPKNSSADTVRLLGRQR